MARKEDLETEVEQKVYELLTRHFLASLAKNAQGEKSEITLKIADEEFSATGIQITEKNFLEVYHYDKWAEQELPKLNQGDMIQPKSIDVNVG